MDNSTLSVEAVASSSQSALVKTMPKRVGAAFLPAERGGFTPECEVYRVREVNLLTVRGVPSSLLRPKWRGTTPITLLAGEYAMQFDRRQGASPGKLLGQWIVSPQETIKTALPVWDVFQPPVGEVRGVFTPIAGVVRVEQTNEHLVVFVADEPVARVAAALLKNRTVAGLDFVENQVLSEGALLFSIIGPASCEVRRVNRGFFRSRLAVETHLERRGLPPDDEVRNAAVANVAASLTGLLPVIPDYPWRPRTYLRVRVSQWLAHGGARSPDFLSALAEGTLDGVLDKTEAAGSVSLAKLKQVVGLVPPREIPKAMGVDFLPLARVFADASAVTCDDRTYLRALWVRNTPMPREESDEAVFWFPSWSHGYAAPGYYVLPTFNQRRWEASPAEIELPPLAKGTYFE